eukprot:TRINITY_DN6807_c0_g5_i2.p4 TRINITY_DN6807_c0_g5~~TRINITY_DN6807_c0_g5_i2.p4  ORF type:complete len:296 (+),score=55.30 TRINITY_DN6807_c0_g5_i2:1240-2127(+)
MTIKSTYGSSGGTSNAELSEHVADTVRHITSTERTNWNNKANASTLTSHVGNSTIHITSTERTNWNNKANASTLTSHVGNSTIHITSTERTAWNAKANVADIPSDLSELSDTSNLLDAATITVGTVTTGAAGSNASATNVGTSRNAVFNFTIPRGNNGFYFTPSISAAGELSFTNNGGLTNPAPINVADISRTTRIGASLTLIGTMSIDCANVDMRPATLASGATATINQTSFTNLAVGSGIIVAVTNSGGTLNFVNIDSTTIVALTSSQTDTYWLSFFRDASGYRFTGKGRIYQ